MTNSIPLEYITHPQIEQRSSHHNVEHIFIYYTRMESFEKVGRESGLRTKAMNTVMDVRPLWLRKAYVEPGAREEFDRLMVGLVGTSGALNWWN